MDFRLADGLTCKPPLVLLFEKEGYEKLFSNADEEVFKIDLEEEEEDGE